MMRLPHRIPSFIPYFFPRLTWHVPTTQREVYLTFDDGPVYGPTEFVLDTLKSASAKGTFFCIGDNVRKHPEVFRRILSAGHAVGNHTFNHLSGWSTSTDLYLKNVQLCDDEMTRHMSNQSLKLMRPPYGRIKRSQIRELANYKIVMWDVLSFDFEKRLSPEKCLSRTLAAVRPGSIIVFHDSIKAERNMMFALPRLLNSLAEQGYTFKSLTP